MLKADGRLCLIFQEITTGPPSPLQSPARSSQTWWTRSSLTRSLTPRSSGNAPPPSARWTEKTAQLQTKRRRRRSRRWPTAWPVRDGAGIIIQFFLILFDHGGRQTTIPGLAVPHSSSALNHKLRRRPRESRTPSRCPPPHPHVPQRWDGRRRLAMMNSTQQRWSHLYERLYRRERPI